MHAGYVVCVVDRNGLRFLYNRILGKNLFGEDLLPRKDDVLFRICGSGTAGSGGLEVVWVDFIRFDGFLGVCN